MVEEQLGGYTIPAGVPVLASVYHAMSKDDSYWSSPEEFDPERFLDENHVKAITRPNQCFLPFATGRRACLGEKLALANLFLITSRVLQRTMGFKWEVDLDGSHIKDPKDLMKGDIMRTDFFGPENFHIKLTPLVMQRG